MHQLALALSTEFVIHSRHEPPVDLLNDPHQWVLTAVHGLAVQSRNEAAAQTGLPKRGGLAHHDPKLTWAYLNSALAEGHGLLRLA